MAELGNYHQTAWPADEKPPPFPRRAEACCRGNDPLRTDGNQPQERPSAHYTCSTCMCTAGSGECLDALNLSFDFQPITINPSFKLLLLEQMWVKLYWAALNILKLQRFIHNDDI